MGDRDEIQFSTDVEATLQEEVDKEAIHFQERLQTWESLPKLTPNEEMQQQFAKTQAVLEGELDKLKDQHDPAAYMQAAALNTAWGVNKILQKEARLFGKLEKAMGVDELPKENDQ